jgi:hypothetical protein
MRQPLTARSRLRVYLAFDIAAKAGGIMMLHTRLNWMVESILAGLLSGCSNSSNTDAQMEARPVPWIDNAWTQPVPAWGSPVRLNLPIPLGSIVFGPGGGFGAFGAHEGGHVEGLNLSNDARKLGILK